MKQLLRVILYLVCISLLIAGGVYAHRRVYAMWKDVGMRQALLQDVPAQSSRTSVLKKELDGALSQMQGIYAQVPTSNQLVDVISAISGLAVSSGVSAQVPVVQQQTLAAKVTPLPTELFSDVRIHVVASGTPAALITFLYRIEHLPYILKVAYWKMDTTQQSAVASFTNTAPSDTKAAVPGTSLEADILIMTKKK